MPATVLLVRLEPTQQKVQLAKSVQKGTIHLKEPENAQKLLLDIAQMRILLVMLNVELVTIPRVVPLYVLPVQQVLPLAVPLRLILTTVSNVRRARLQKVRERESVCLAGLKPR